MFCHREEFDEEKEPEGMVLSGWTQSPATKGESASTSNNESAVEVTESSSGPEIASKKRKLSETQPENHKIETENVESEDDDDLMEIENPMTVSKKKRVA